MSKHVKQFSTGLYQHWNLVTVVSDDGITWQKPGYTDDGWVIRQEDHLFAIYEFNNGPELFYQFEDTLQEAVIIAETEIL